MVRRKNPSKRPRRRPARKSNKPKAAKLNQMIVHNVSRPKPQIFRKTALFNQNTSNVITGSGVPTTLIGGALVQSMPDFTSITALYNRYKMKKITYTFNLQATGGFSLFALDLPKMLIRYNYDSNLTGAGILAKLQEIDNVVQFQFTPEKTQFSYSYYPKTISQVYLSGIAIGYKLNPQQYIDKFYSDVPHYGIMWYIDNLATGLQITYDIAYEVSFKYQN